MDTFEDVEQAYNTLGGLLGAEVELRRRGLTSEELKAKYGDWAQSSRDSEDNLLWVYGTVQAVTGTHLELVVHLEGSNMPFAFSGDSLDRVSYRVL